MTQSTPSHTARYLLGVTWKKNTKKKMKSIQAQVESDRGVMQNLKEGVVILAWAAYLSFVFIAAGHTPNHTVGQTIERK